MGCLPESGACERQRTDPFVHHLNWLEGANYVHNVCLDVLHRNSPQPEALYIDEGSDRRLVIERKNLVWPPEYALGHKNDHFVVDLVSDGLKGLIRDDAYELQLEFATGCPLGRSDHCGCGWKAARWIPCGGLYATWEVRGGSASWMP